MMHYILLGVGEHGREGCIILVSQPHVYINLLTYVKSPVASLCLVCSSLRCLERGPNDFFADSGEYEVDEAHPMVMNVAGSVVLQQRSRLRC